MADSHIIASLINHDNYRGAIIPARPEEIQMQKSLKQLPFISRVKNLDPIGFKLQSQLFTNRNKNKVSSIEQKNRDFIKLLSKSNKTEKEILDKQEEIIKQKNEKQKNRLGKQNEILNEIRRELYGANDENTLSKDIQEIRKEIYGDKNNNIDLVKSSTNFTKQTAKQLDPIIKDEPPNEEKTELKKKSNLMKPKWAMTQEEAENLNDEKIDELIKFAENLDYEKYIKDLEIKEALNLIKYKVNQKQNEDGNNEKEDEINQDQDTDKEPQKKEIEEDSLKLPIIHNSKPLEHDAEWNSSVKVLENPLKQDEKIKKVIADEVLKSNPLFKQVHSTQSIKKILEREGLLNPSQSNLVISVIKERDGIHNYSYKPAVLPNLREHPGV